MTQWFFSSFRSDLTLYADDCGFTLRGNSTNTHYTKQSPYHSCNTNAPCTTQACHSGTSGAQCPEFQQPRRSGPNTVMDRKSSTQEVLVPGPVLGTWERQNTDQDRDGPYKQINKWAIIMSHVPGTMLSVSCTQFQTMITIIHKLGTLKLRK